MYFRRISRIKAFKKRNKWFKETGEGKYGHFNIRYEAKKYSRCKKGYTKLKGEKYRNFMGVECRVDGRAFEWSDSEQRWLFNGYRGVWISNQDIDNVKQLTRFAKKQSSYLPKGTVLTMLSSFENNNIICTIK